MIPTTSLCGYSCNFYFVKQLKGNANLDSGNPNSKKYLEEASHCAQSSLYSHSCDESFSTPSNNLHQSGFKPVVDQYSDDSDSEIFRVKRRTLLKVDKRDVNDALHLKRSDRQVHFKCLNF